ncbi:hypothetical protein RRG08_052280 [Elysia crispata]|uniref:Uncharacterized protein n=1 Tax=Elysia crispata TaxID=231223 RepID=A0AAE0ZYQ1_9GAST|nr:hypothetical protein RRG08_052280 [Elysia crispata]
MGKRVGLGPSIKIGRFPIRKCLHRDIFSFKINLTTPVTTFEDEVKISQQMPEMCGELRPLFFNLSGRCGPEQHGRKASATNTRH